MVFFFSSNGSPIVSASLMNHKWCCNSIINTAVSRVSFHWSVSVPVPVYCLISIDLKIYIFIIGKAISPHCFPFSKCSCHSCDSSPREFWNQCVCHDPQKILLGFFFLIGIALNLEIHLGLSVFGNLYLYSIGFSHSTAWYN